jgi:hypothetical protein
MFSKRFTTKHQSAIGFEAINLTFIQGRTFTFAAFCQQTGFKPNRHTRRELDNLVRDGYLLKLKALFSDGHYRMVYAAQKTYSLPWVGL